MIELEYQNIRFAAVYARVFEQVLDDSTQILGRIPRGVALGIGDIGVLVALVMASVPRVLTVAAEGVSAA